MEAKFGPLDNRIKNSVIGVKFFRRTVGYTHLTAERMKKYWKNSK